MNPAPWRQFNLEDGHLPGNIAGVHTSNARQRKQPTQRSSAPNTANAVAANNSDLLSDASSRTNPSQASLAPTNGTRHSKKRQRQVGGQAGNVTLPRQTSMIVPLSHDTRQAYSREQLHEMEMANMEEQKNVLLQDMESVVKEVGVNENMGLAEVMFPVHVYAECCAEQAKMEKAHEKGAELEREKGKRAMQNNLNAVASKERKAALIQPLINVIDLLITENKNLHSENRKLRLRPSTSGGPGSSVPSSSGGPAFHAGSSSRDGKLNNCSTPVDRTPMPDNRPARRKATEDSLSTNRARHMLPLLLPISVGQSPSLAFPFNGVTEKDLIPRPRNRSRERKSLTDTDGRV